MITTEPRIIDKPVIDASGNWTTAPHIVWRDATGLHDRPATMDALRDIPALVAAQAKHHPITKEN